MTERMTDERFEKLTTENWISQDDLFDLLTEARRARKAEETLEARVTRLAEFHKDGAKIAAEQAGEIAAHRDAADASEKRVKELEAILDRYKDHEEKYEAWLLEQNEELPALDLGRAAMACVPEAAESKLDCHYDVGASGDKSHFDGLVNVARFVLAALMSERGGTAAGSDMPYGLDLGRWRRKLAAAARATLGAEVVPDEDAEPHRRILVDHYGLAEDAPWSDVHLAVRNWTTDHNRTAGALAAERDTLRAELDPLRRVAEAARIVDRDPTGGWCSSRHSLHEALAALPGVRCPKHTIEHAARVFAKPASEKPPLAPAPWASCCPTPRFDASGKVYDHCVNCGAPRPAAETPPSAAVPCRYCRAFGSDTQCGKTLCDCGCHKKTSEAVPAVSRERAQHKSERSSGREASKTARLSVASGKDPRPRCRHCNEPRGEHHLGTCWLMGGSTRESGITAMLVNEEHCEPSSVAQDDPCPPNRPVMTEWGYEEHHGIAWLYRENERVRARLDALERHPWIKDGGK